MIRILLVDDEFYIRERLKIIVDWESLGFQVVGEAENGTQALELVGQVHPDMLIVDIRMPEMDGLALTEQVRREHPHILSIILTGYNAFEYAQKAIRNGVVGYLLKPVNRKELVEQLELVRGRLEAARHNRQNLRLAKAVQWEECMNYLVYEEAPPPDLADAMASLSASLPTGFLLLFRLQEVRVSHHLKVNILDMLEEQLPNTPLHLFSPAEGLVAACICHPADPALWGPFEALYQQLCAQYPGVSHLAASDEFSALADLGKAYQKAQFALRESIFLPDIVVDGEKALNGHVRERMPLESLREQMLCALRCGNLSQALGFMDKQFELLREKYRSYGNLSILVNELTGISAIYAGESGGLLLNGSEQTQGFLEGFHQLQEVREWFIQSFTELTEQKGSKKPSAQFLMTQQAKEVIDANFHNPDCSLDFVASTVGCNPNYLSGIFKKVTGISVVQYITNRRMEQAKILLRQRCKLAEICEQVGYNDVFYFSRRFKQFFGVPPSDFA